MRSYLRFMEASPPDRQALVSVIDDGVTMLRNVICNPALTFDETVAALQAIEQEAKRLLIIAGV